MGRNVPINKNNTQTYYRCGYWSFSGVFLLFLVEVSQTLRVTGFQVYTTQDW